MACQPTHYTSASRDEDSRFHGGAEYTKSIYYQILKARRNWHIDAVFNPASTLDEGLRAASNEAGVECFPIQSSDDLQKIINGGNYRRFFSSLPNQTYSGINFLNTEVIFTLHGLRPLEMPGDRYELRYETALKRKLRILLKWAFMGRYVKRVSRLLKAILSIRTPQLTVFTDSFHSKYALMRFFAETDTHHQVLVLYPPPSSVMYATPNPSFLGSHGLIERDYVLLVSGGKWIKNGYRAIAALDELIAAGQLKKKVVATGITNPDIFNVKRREQFEFLPYVEVDDLAALYQNAFCLLYPTLNEGFGYPPLESMRFGTPVISSAVTSLTEICGDAALYVSPYSLQEIQTRILYIQNEPGVWDLYSERASARYAQINAIQETALNKYIDQILAE